MKRLVFQQGDREVLPGQGSKRGSAGQGAKARRAARRAAGLALAAEQLVQRIEADSRQRQRTWRAGEAIDEFGVARRDDNLAGLHQDKREMRREIYDRAPQLEGRPVLKGTPGGRS